ALELDVPRTIVNECRPANGFGFPEHNTVTYELPATKYTTKSLKWIWYDGPGAPPLHEDLILPGMDTQADRNTSIVTGPAKVALEAKVAAEAELPEQGAMFVGEKGRLLLPHFMQLPGKIVKGKYVDITKESEQVSEKHGLGSPV